MSVTEAQRHRLYESLKAAIGVEEADIMMSLVPPTGWGDVVSKDDLRADFAIFRSEVNADFAAFRAEVTAEFAAVRSEMAAESAQLRAEMASALHQQTRSLGTWLFASQAVVIAAIGLLLGIAH
ncbi:MAG: hypothetical protein WD225_12085 [Ilumatobacteraceae bacterium]